MPQLWEHWQLGQGMGVLNPEVQESILGLQALNMQSKTATLPCWNEPEREPEHEPEREQG